MVSRRWWKAVTIIALAAVPVAGLRAQGAADAVAIGHVVAGFHAEGRFDGSVLVARDGEVIYEAGFGEADRTWHVPNRPETVFLVGSVSKQFTAMLILQLAAEGELSLMDPVVKHLSGYPADKAEITIHHLLSHSSGLPHYGGFAAIDVDLGDYLRLDRPVSRYVELIGKLELQSEPGARYAYSSMGYIVLAYIAEQVTGKSYGRLIEERIAAPIGVRDLGFAYNDRPVDRLAHGYVYEIIAAADGDLALGYLPEPYRDQSNKYSTGGVHASVRALARWARAVTGEELLPAAWRERMWTPQAGTYGYGWRIESGDSIGLPESVEVISHGGSLSGYRASIKILDRGRYTLIALGNSGASLSPMVTEAIARLLHGRDPGPINILGTAAAWRLIRSGPEVAAAFVRQQREAEMSRYVDHPFAFSAYAEELIEKGRGAWGLALADLGLEGHPNSAALVLARARGLHARGDHAGAREAAEKAVGLSVFGGGDPSIEQQARELLAAIEAASVAAAAAG